MPEMLLALGLLLKPKILYFPGRQDVGKQSAHQWTRTEKAHRAGDAPWQMAVQLLLTHCPDGELTACLNSLLLLVGSPIPLHFPSGLCTLSDIFPLHFNKTFNYR